MKSLKLLILTISLCMLGSLNPANANYPQEDVNDPYYEDSYYENDYVAVPKASARSHKKVIHMYGDHTNNTNLYIKLPLQQLILGFSFLIFLVLIAIPFEEAGGFCLDPNKNLANRWRSELWSHISDMKFKAIAWDLLNFIILPITSFLFLRLLLYLLLPRETAPSRKHRGSA